MNDPHVPLWIIVTNEGPILSAHCMAGCMAGLGECCSHIASMLFYVECWTRIHGKLACTEVKCAWLLPSTVKDIRYSKAKDINFTSATKLKSDLDTSIDNLGCVQSEENQQLARSVAKCIGPTQNELNYFLHSVNECKSKPVCLSLADPYYKSFTSTTRNIKTVPELFQKSFMDISYPELLKKCNEVEIKLTENEIFPIERDTFDQAAGKSFFRHHAGRIGASRCHAVCHTDPAKPSQSLIKSICYPDVFNFSTKATRHGCQHEAFAISSYEGVMKTKQKDFRIKKCGTVINKKYQFLHATPDFYYECSCCGKGCGEVKCPYCIDGLDFDGYVKKRASCLEKNGDCFSLKRDHAYYYQVQQQLHTTGRSYCDFIVFSTDGENWVFFQERALDCGMKTFRSWKSSGEPVFCLRYLEDGKQESWI